jgi:cobalt-zinc-cadmium efflux system protein
MPHNHEPAKGITLAFFLNLGFAIAELIGGFYTNSLSILSNGLHDLGDSASLGVAWVFERVSKNTRTKRFSYGYKRFSLISALINSLILLSGSLFILTEAVPRLLNPVESNTEGMFLFAVVGVVINLAAYLKLKKGTSLNEQVSALHLLDDVMGLTSVAIISVIMKFWYVPVLDAVLSIVITIYLLINILKNLQKTVAIFLQSTPENVDLPEIEALVMQIPGVLAIHDVHVWSLDGENNVFTTHVVVPNNASHEEMVKIKRKAKEIIETKNISHATLEIECMDEGCGLLDH